MRRREFIMLAGAAVAGRARAGRAQPAGVPVIGFLHSGAPEQNAKRLAGFLEGLEDGGFVDGKSVAIEYRWAAGHNDKLPEMAADLIRRHVAVIVTAGSTPASVVAKKATATIPVIFAVGADPVAVGLVSSLARPGGNVTGVTSLNVDLAAKRFEVARELAPQAEHYFAVVNPTSPLSGQFIKDLGVGAASLGIRFDTLRATNDGEIEALFAGLPQRGAVLLFCPDSFFYIRRMRIAGLATQHGVPAIFDDREYVDAGALASYGADWTQVMRTAGDYTARILKGAKPADLPVVQPARFVMAINLKTAKALGLGVPPFLLAQADEVIE